MDALRSASTGLANASSSHHRHHLPLLLISSLADHVPFSNKVVVTSLLSSHLPTQESHVTLVHHSQESRHCGAGVPWPWEPPEATGDHGVLCILIQLAREKKRDRHEAIYSFYFGDYRHISVQGEYLTYQETYLAVAGGSGIFAWVTRQVKLTQIVFPYKLFYTSYLRGIGELPAELLGEPVPPSPKARAAHPEATVKKFTM